MPILTEDIKLLQSAVMADVPEGGGAMTGVAVIDGQSNNLLPDTSAMDRAFGRVNARKLFGVAQTDDTATLMGAHAIITQGPGDPLVQCTLMKTASWSDTRTVAKDGIEKYLVKGPKISYRMYDTHYAGSLQLRLVSLVGGTPPAGGDALVLRNPNGQEQYVRILKVSTATQVIAVSESNGTVLISASVATCDLGNPLAYDFSGPPAMRVGLVEANYAQVYGTNIAGGAKFYGIKKLGTAGAPGDYSVLTSGGIYTPVVPAATVESPIIDQHPLLGRSSLVVTAAAQVTLAGVAVSAVGPGSTVTLPTAVEPKSLSFTLGATAFSDDGTGAILQGTLTVGTVDYKTGVATLSAGAPSYGAGTLTASFRPATVVGASAFSAGFTITIANQGLAFTSVFIPAPARGSFKLSYMAQGRWYELVDNFNGKLAGADSSYGTGTIDYATGSMSLTLGAIPDVGSMLIADWGDASSAKAVSPANVQLKAGCRVTMNPSTKGDEITVTWSRGGTNYTASTDVNGLLTGNATGSYANSVLSIEPNVFPDGNFSITSKLAATGGVSGITVNGGGSYTLTGVLPVTPGTFRAQVLASYAANVVFPTSPLSMWDAAGVIYARLGGNSGSWYDMAAAIAIGTINYATGAITINASVNAQRWVRLYSKGPWGGPVEVNEIQSTPITLLSPITGVSYASGAVAPTMQAVTPTSWTISVITNGPAMLTTGTMFKLGASYYTASSGILRRGWDISVGSPTIGSAGTVSSDGVITFTALPTDFTNGLTWYNVAQDASARQISSGVFRTLSAPLKTGVYQMLAGVLTGTADDTGVISGGQFSGTVDYQRGIVNWASSTHVDPASVSYNAVFLQYLPLDKDLLGLDTVRLPLDGKVPIYRTGDLLVVHNTLTTQLPNPLVKGTAYSLGRERIASVRVKDALGVVVPSSLYVSDLNPGTITVPAGSVITAYTQPLTVEHRIEDMMLCSQADISGQLKFTRSLTHSFPANTSFVSSALPFGDLFSRAYSYIEQGTWSGAWSDVLIGAAPLSNFNEGQYPIVTTNRGAITERWAIIFTNSTAFRIVGEGVGEIGSGTTVSAIAPINPATGAAYFTLPALGWGNGWAAGNVLRFNTAACGAPFWLIRTVLQGPASLDSDVFSIAFRGDVDRP